MRAIDRQRVGTTAQGEVQVFEFLVGDPSSSHVQARERSAGERGAVLAGVSRVIDRQDIVVRTAPQVQVTLDLVGR